MMAFGEKPNNDGGLDILSAPIDGGDAGGAGTGAPAARRRIPAETPNKVGGLNDPPAEEGGMTGTGASTTGAGFSVGTRMRDAVSRDMPNKVGGEKLPLGFAGASAAIPTAATGSKDCHAPPDGVAAGGGGAGYALSPNNVGGLNASARGAVAAVGCAAASGSLVPPITPDCACMGPLSGTLGNIVFATATSSRGISPSNEGSISMESGPI